MNPHEPGFYFGGAQDNGTTGGNEMGINDWPRIFGGDGFQMIFHPTNPLIHYVETQNGRIRVTLDGGNSYPSATRGLSGSRNWDMQYIMSSADPNMLYVGTDKMFRSISDTIPFWVEISGNLTDTLDTYGYQHNITTLDESPLNTDYLYCATSDGFVWRSLDFGVTWDQINDGLPRRYISNVKASPFDENTVYLSIQGYKDNDNTPYIYKSTDNGDNWVNINGNLPQIAINNILVLPTDPDEQTIFVGTDGGVFYTLDGGLTWDRLGDNMPIFPIFDLDVTPDNKLVAGSFARGIYTFDLGQLEQTGNEEVVLANDLKVYPTITNDRLSIESNLAISELNIRIIASNGTQVLERLIRNGAILDVSALQRGNYFLVSEVGIQQFIKI